MGYRQATNILSAHTTDAEEMIARLQEKMQRVHEERTRMGEEIKAIVGKEMEQVLTRWRLRRGEIEQEDNEAVGKVCEEEE